MQPRSFAINYNWIGSGYHPDQAQINANHLKGEGHEQELDADTSGLATTAGEGLAAGDGVAPCGGLLDRVIVDIPDAVPTHEHAVKQRNVLQKGIEQEPLHEKADNIDDCEDDGNLYHQFIRLVPVRTEYIIKT